MLIINIQMTQKYAEYKVPSSLILFLGIFTLRPECAQPPSRGGIWVLNAELGWQAYSSWTSQDWAHFHVCSVDSWHVVSNLSSRSPLFTMLHHGHFLAAPLTHPTHSCLRTFTCDAFLLALPPYIKWTVSSLLSGLSANATLLETPPGHLR